MLFLVQGVLKICRKFTGENPYLSVIPVKLQSNFIEITLQHRCSPVNFCCIFSEQLFRRTPLGGCFYQFMLLVFFSPHWKHWKPRFILVDGNAGKIRLAWFDHSKNSDHVDGKIDESVLSESKFFKMLELHFSSRLDWCSYTVPTAKTWSLRMFYEAYFFSGCTWSL